MKKILIILMCALLTACVCSCDSRNYDEMESRASQLENELADTQSRLAEAEVELSDKAAVKAANASMRDEIDKLEEALEKERSYLHTSYDFGYGQYLFVKQEFDGYILTNYNWPADVETEVLRTKELVGISVSGQTAIINTGTELYSYKNDKITAEKLAISCLPTDGIICDAVSFDDTNILITAYTENEIGVRSGKVYIYNIENKSGSLLVDTDSDALSIRQADLYGDEYLGPQMLFIELEGYDKNGNVDNLYYYYLGADDIRQLISDGNVLTVHLN